MTPELKKKKHPAYKNIISGIIWVLFIFFIFYLLPVGLLTIKNFFKLVVFSGWRMDEFAKSIELFSIRPVNDFYMELWGWLKCLSRGVCSLKR